MDQSELEKVKEKLTEIVLNKQTNFVEVYGYVGESSCTDTLKRLNAHYLEDEKEKLEVLPSFTSPTFYGKPCLLCNKKDYYLISCNITEENSRRDNIFQYHCPNCKILYSEYDYFSWSY